MLYYLEPGFDEGMDGLVDANKKQGINSLPLSIQDYIDQMKNYFCNSEN